MRRLVFPVLAAAAAVVALAASGRAAAPAAPRKALLVVAPERFHPALAEFVRHKRAQLPTRLVSLEKVLASSPGEDDPARVKQFLYAAWKKDAGYALLVGDADLFPVRYMVLDRVTPAAFDYAFYPSDLYYSDLAKADGSFDGWNGRRDGFHAGYYGEVRGEKNKHGPINYDEIDYRPDIAVGRWPVSTVEQLQTVAAKTIAYEEGVLSGRAPGMRRAALFAVGGWVDSRGPMDRMASELAPAWSVEKRYYGRPGPARSGQDESTPPPDAVQVQTLLNEGVGLAIHAGHGSDNTWEGCFSVPKLAGIKNRDRLPVVISAGCSTAHFAALGPYEAYTDVNGNEHPGTDHGELFNSPPPAPAPYQRGAHAPGGLGKAFLRDGPDGAVAYIGCNTGSQPCGLTLVEGFVDTLSRSKEPRLGDCWAGAVRYYYDHEHLATLKPTEDWYPASIFFQGMKFMLFGDPSLQMPWPVRQETSAGGAR